MLVISYDISDDKIRGHFAKMLSKNGAIRLQYSVYEVNNTKRLVDNIMLKIKNIYSKDFTGADSVIIFDVGLNQITKFGNAIHRDTDIVYF